jgi:hypothetical protein
MSYTPLDSDFLTSTMLKEGPDVVAIWTLLLASTDKVGESSMQPAAAASLLRISDERAEAAFAVLAAPDPKSRNKEHQGKRILPVEGGKWFIVSAQKYQWLASRAAATIRQRKYDANKRSREAKGEAKAERCESPGCKAKAAEAVDGMMLCSKHSFWPEADPAPEA